MPKTFIAPPLFSSQLLLIQPTLIAIALVFLFSACATIPPPNSLMGGKWEIQEEDRSYIATLDENGNGTYTWKNGKIQTIECIDKLWKGTWHQSGNDREGEFEVVLSEDGQEAKGVWWYTRVGENKDIPPKQFGGDFVWVRPSSNSIKTAD